MNGLRALPPAAAGRNGDRDEWKSTMPELMDLHTGMAGLSAEDLATAHAADVAIQAEEQVAFKHAWTDPESGVVFCLSEAPDAAAVSRIHERAGHPADKIHQAPLNA